jgi:transposase-like protein
MIGFTAHRLMELEVETLAGPAHGALSAERLTYRNGYRERELGNPCRHIPRLRKGSYFPGFLEPRRMAEKALTAVVQEPYVHGVSTHSVDDLVQAMGMTGISKSLRRNSIQKVSASERPMSMPSNRDARPSRFAWGEAGDLRCA